MGFAIATFKKRKHLDVELEKHLTRGNEEMDISPENAREEDMKKNVFFLNTDSKMNVFDREGLVSYFKDNKINVRKLIDKRIQEGYKQAKTIRKDAVKVVEYIASFSADSNFNLKELNFQILK